MSKPELEHITPKEAYDMLYERLAEAMVFLLIWDD